MPQENFDLKSELRHLKIENGIYKRVNCKPEQNKLYASILKQNGKLPDGVYKSEYLSDEQTYEFYTIQKNDITDQEINEYLLMKMMQNIKTIKNCVVYFVVLSVISIFLSLILLLSL